MNINPMSSMRRRWQSYVIGISRGLFLMSSPNLHVENIFGKLVAVNRSLKLICPKIVHWKQLNIIIRIDF